MAMLIRELVFKTLEGMGFELVDLVLSPNGGVQLFIDHLDPQQGSISIEDCVLISNHLKHIFAVENVDYARLEVSSPGLDRLVSQLKDFERFQGALVKIKLREPVEGRQRLTGRILPVLKGQVCISAEEKRWELALDQIERARLVPEFERSSPLKIP